MSATLIVGKRLVSKDAVIRRKIARRVKFALGLIVTRGADVKKVRSAKGKVQEIFVEGEGSRDMILQDWTYVFTPSLEVYRMPYQTLIVILREALMKIRDRAVALEKQWSAQRLEAKSRPSKSVKVQTSPRHNVAQAKADAMKFVFVKEASPVPSASGATSRRVHPNHDMTDSEHVRVPTGSKSSHAKDRALASKKLSSKQKKPTERPSRVRKSSIGRSLNSKSREKPFPTQRFAVPFLKSFPPKDPTARAFIESVPEELDTTGVSRAPRLFRPRAETLTGNERRK